MKKRISIMLIAILLISSLAACGKKGEDAGETVAGAGTDSQSSDTKEEVVQIDANDLDIASGVLAAPCEERSMVEGAGADAVNAYILARMYAEKLEHYDASKGNKEEYDALLQQTIDAFDMASKLSDNSYNMAEVLEALEATGGYVGTKDGASSYVDEDYSAKAEEVIRKESLSEKLGLKITAQASSKKKQAEAKAWAESLTKTFDSAPAGKKIKALMEVTGKDAKRAYAEFTQAQEMMKANAYDDFGSYCDTGVKVCTGLKAAGTAAGYTATVLSCGAYATVTEAAGLVVGGVNTVVEVSNAAAVITLGENSKSAVTIGKAQSMLAPINNVFGIIGLGSWNNGTDVVNNVSFITDSIIDFTSNGQLFGGTFKKNEKGEMKFNLGKIYFGDDKKENEEKTKNTLQTIGIDPDQAKQIASQMAEAAAKGAIDEATGAEGTKESGDSKNTEQPSDSEILEQAMTIPPETYEPIIEAGWTPALHVEGMDPFDPDTFDVDEYIEKVDEKFVEVVEKNYGEGIDLSKLNPEANVAGTYQMHAENASTNVVVDTEATVEVDGKVMKITFDPNFGTANFVKYITVEGEYNPETGKYSGMNTNMPGDDELFAASYFEYLPLVLQFDTGASPIYAKGGLDTSSIDKFREWYETDVTITKVKKGLAGKSSIDNEGASSDDTKEGDDTNSKDNGKPLSKQNVAGKYHFYGDNKMLGDSNYDYGMMEFTVEGTKLYARHIPSDTTCVLDYDEEKGIGINETEKSKFLVQFFKSELDGTYEAHLEMESEGELICSFDATKEAGS